MKQFTASEQSQEDRIESIVRKSMEKYVEDKLIKDLKNTFNCLMSNNYNEVFEDQVVPCFEKYLTKVFDKICSLFDKGLKYYSEKISLEERKINQFKDNFTLIVNQFTSNSKTFQKMATDLGQV